MPTNQSYLELLCPGECTRFWEKVDKTADCWNWIATISPCGYGGFYLRGRRVYAHRVSFVLEHGAISDRLVIDHLCRNRRCVNPSHMRELTSADNVRAGIPHGRTVTHCAKGHPFDAVNTQHIKARGATMRVCAICHNQRNREYRKRQKGADV